MRAMTRENLSNAYAGESQAHMRYLIYADVAEKEGKANIARLFRAVAYAERVHATAHLHELGMVNDTSQNLSAAIGGENFEVDEMYPAYNKVAELQEEKGAARSTLYAWEAEKIHAKFYADAKARTDAGEDLDIGKLHVCPVCGYTGEGEAPEACPVCKTKADRFRYFSD